MKRLRLNGPLVLGLILLLGLIVLVVLPAFVTLKHPHMSHVVMMVGDKLRVPPYNPGEGGYILGSDLLGRDYLSRLIYGARYTLGIALGINAVRALISIPLGLVAGWYGGALGRFVQASSSGMGAIPTLLLVAMSLFGLRSIVVDPTKWIFIYCVIVVFAGVPRMAEYVRQRASDVSLLPHIEAAVATGAGSGRMIRKHVAPLMRGDILVLLASETAWVLLMMGQLAVFGIYVGGSAALPGVMGEPRNISEYWPEWGQMFGRTRGAILQRAWLPLLPGMLLAATAACFHLLAEGLRLRWLRR